MWWPPPSSSGSRHEILAPEPFAGSGVGFCAVAVSDIFLKISQNLSPAGVTSPFVARPMPTDRPSVVPVAGSDNEPLFESRRGTSGAYSRGDFIVVHRPI
jgi:hypothetical protein